jgi:hypothetical protein
MPYDIWLEYDEELMDWGENGFIDHSDLEFDDEDDEPSYADLVSDKIDDEDGCGHSEHEYMAFMPMYLYCNPINEGFKLDCPFDPSGHTHLHLVIVRYNQDDGDILRCGLWTVYRVCESRREAWIIAQQIQEDELEEENLVWKRNGAKMETAGVVSLPIEN